MSENQNYADILDKEYIGFFTESAKEDLEDVINLIDLISIMFGERHCGASSEITNKVIVSLFNIIYRELETIKSGMHLSGGIFHGTKLKPQGLPRNKK